MNKKQEEENKAKVEVYIRKNHNDKRKWKYYYNVTVTTKNEKREEGGYASWLWLARLWARATVKELLRGRYTIVYQKEFDVKVQ